MFSLKPPRHISTYQSRRSDHPPVTSGLPPQIVSAKTSRGFFITINGLKQEKNEFICAKIAANWHSATTL
jgi:hypothetical protein